MKLTKFNIETKEDVVVNGEYEGNINSKKVITFSHGFGVARSSHGMFNDLGDAFKKDYIVVRFDYSIVNKKENWTKVVSFNSQIKMLRAVKIYIDSIFNPLETNIVAHSMGCLVVGLANLNQISNTILLAGPTVKPYKDLASYFSKRPQTTFNEKGLSALKRSDGSITYVQKEFWEELKNTDPLKAYEDISNNSKVTYIRALNDQVITKSNYKDLAKIKKFGYYQLNGNHDFEGSARPELIKLLKNVL